jgi:ABC-type antimicrobial peptide transport system permease subunit
VGNVKHRALSASFTPEYYLPYQQIPALLTICVRTKIDPMAVVPDVKREVAMLDPDVPIYHVETLENYVEASLAPSRYRTTLLEAFAFLALLLTTTGTYSVIAYTVIQRTQEIGIRMALGATRANIIYMVLKTGLRLTALGGIIGIIAAVVLARSLSSLTSLLFAVKPLDPATFLVVIGLLIITCLLATYVPARRAATLDPIIALRRGQ